MGPGQSKPVGPARVPGAREREGGCCVARWEAARRHRLGEAAPGPLQSRARSQILAVCCQKQLILEGRRVGRVLGAWSC